MESNRKPKVPQVIQWSEELLDVIERGDFPFARSGEFIPMEALQKAGIIFIAPDHVEAYAESAELMHLLYGLPGRRVIKRPDGSTQEIRGNADPMNN